MALVFCCCVFRLRNSCDFAIRRWRIGTTSPFVDIPNLHHELLGGESWRGIFVLYGFPLVGLFGGTVLCHAGPADAFCAFHVDTHCSPAYYRVSMVSFPTPVGIAAIDVPQLFINGKLRLRHVGCMVLPSAWCMVFQQVSAMCLFLDNDLHDILVTYGFLQRHI